MTFSKLAAAGLVAGALALPMAATAQDAKPGEFKIPGTETTLKLNGFVELDVTYDFDGSDDNIRENDWASFLEFQPLDDQDVQKNMLYLTPKTSRIGITTSTPTAWGPLAVRVEGDFNSPSPFNFSTEATTNGVTFRLRHAYGEVGGLLIGQTWSNFNDLGSFPDTVDFNGHGAFGANRSPMIRYALPVGPGSLAVSLENPQSVVSNAEYPASVTVGRFYDRYPDLTANFTMPFSAGHISLRGMATEYHGQVDVTDESTEDEVWGWGVGASGSLKFGPGLLVAGVQGGDGIGRYLFQTLFQGAGFTAGGDIETWMSWCYHVGLTWNWSPAVRSNVIWTQTFIDENDDLTAAGVFGAPSLVNKRVDAGYVNTFFSPVKNFETGVEYSYGQRVVAEGGVAPGAEDKGTQHRINALFRYTFF